MNSTGSPSAHFRNSVNPVWCPGCGDFAALDALTAALAAGGKLTSDVAVVSGIGCSSRLANYLSCAAFNTLHGRALPVACGLKSVRPELEVVVITGDGDGFAIGRRHIAPAIARGLQLTWIVLDNGVYGLTKGQASPTSPSGCITGVTPRGKQEAALNPLLLLLELGCGWVAQGSSADPANLTLLMQAALQYPGFRFLNVISPCPVFRGGMALYRELRQHSSHFDHDRADLEQARAAVQAGGMVRLGVAYAAASRQSTAHSVNL